MPDSPFFSGHGLEFYIKKAFHVTADNFDGLAPLVATCNVLGLLPLLFIDRLLDGAAAGSEGDQDKSSYPHK